MWRKTGEQREKRKRKIERKISRARGAQDENDKWKGSRRDAMLVGGPVFVLDECLGDVHNSTMAVRLKGLIYLLHALLNLHIWLCSASGVRCRSSSPWADMTVIILRRSTGSDQRAVMETHGQRTVNEDVVCLTTFTAATQKRCAKNGRQGFSLFWNGGPDQDEASARESGRAE
jgi:hypothetical protein